MIRNSARGLMQWHAVPVLVLLTATAVHADPEVYKQVLRSTGWVIVPGQRTSSSGTCWLADRQRKLVITCRHVVGDAQDVLVYFPSYVKERPVAEAAFYLRNLQTIAGRVIATDTVRDLAVIRLSSVPDGVVEMPLANQSAFPGEDVQSIGNSGLRGDLAEGTLWWYTHGSVRQVHQHSVKTDAGPRKLWLVETQAPVNEGDSGGPVVNSKGQLIGVTNSYTEDERLVSQNIDVREVRAFLKEVRAARPNQDVADRPTPLGGWTFRANGEGGKLLEGDGDFRPDGTFALKRTGRPLEGRYAYANGVLWLIVGDKFATAMPSWRGKDTFSLQLGDAEMTFDRRRVAEEP